MSEVSSYITSTIFSCFRSTFSGLSGIFGGRVVNQGSDASAQVPYQSSINCTPLMSRILEVSLKDYPKLHEYVANNLEKIKEFTSMHEKGTPDYMKDLKKYLIDVSFMCALYERATQGYIEDLYPYRNDKVSRLVEMDVLAKVLTKLIINDEVFGSILNEADIDNALGKILFVMPNRGSYDILCERNNYVIQEPKTFCLKTLPAGEEESRELTDDEVENGLIVTIIAKSQFEYFESEVLRPMLVESISKKNA